MELSSSQVESVVRKVLASMGAAPATSAPCCATGTAQGAVLTAPKTIEIQEVPMPVLGDDDILVKVEGAGVCGTDVHEWKGDPFGMCPVILGHEGTGEVIALGKNIKCDTAGKPLKVGDKIVTSVISCGECHTCRMHPGNTNLCDSQGIFGLMPQNKENPLNGWFATHLLIRAKGAIFSAIDTLLTSVDMTVDMIDKVYVAGGIGSGINMKNAVNIGMLPDVELEKFQYIGNSSLTGAYAMVISNEANAKCAEVAANMTYLELSTYPGYMDSFVAACFIPHTDRSLFPNSVQEM